MEYQGERMKPGELSAKLANEIDLRNLLRELVACIEAHLHPGDEPIESKPEGGLVWPITPLLAKLEEAKAALESGK